MSATLLFLSVFAVQSASDQPAFNGLRTPVSPAFVVLGVAPTMVERPNTPADLAFSILNRTSALASLPRDLALELSPYWLIKHPTLTWEADTTRGLGTSMARTMTLSFATADLGTDTRPVTGLALGFRAAPFSGHLSRGAIDQLKALADRLGTESALIAKLREPRLRQLRQVRDDEIRAASTAADSNAALQRFNQARGNVTRDVMESEDYHAAIDSTEELFRDLALTREGFVLEFAAGGAMQAPGAVADSAKLARWGAWITAGYEGPTLSFIFVNRFLVSTVDTTFDAVDVGMRLLYTSGRYALSAEGSLRTFTESGAPPNEYRVAAVVDFELQKGLWITGTFGRDYRAATPGSLIAQIGVAMNLAGERVQIPVP